MESTNVAEYSAINQKKKSKLRQILKKVNQGKELFLLSLPAMIVVFIFKYIPLYGIILPFKDFKFKKGLFGSEWIGFENFKFLFASNDALNITRNTLLLNFSFIVFGTITALFFAILLNEMSKKAVKVYQTGLFVPYFLSWVAITYVFSAFLDMEHGLLNVFLEKIGKDPVFWYNEQKYWPFILIFANIWKNVGYSTIIYYTGLSGIDESLYEAAYIDGANRFQRIIHISLPLLKPLITILSIMAIGRIFFSDFGLFYNVTLDSPTLYPVTDVIDTYVYRALKVTGDIGMSAAAGLYQSTAGFVLVMVTNYIIRKINSDNALF